MERKEGSPWLFPCNKPNYQALLFGTSLDPETKMRGGASSLALPAYNI